MGVTILPENHAATDLSDGTMVRVLHGYEINGADKEVLLVYPGCRHVSAQTRSFVNFTVNDFRRTSAATPHRRFLQYFKTINCVIRSQSS